MVDALTKRSRFLDISLILRQLERKYVKIDQEVRKRLDEVNEKAGQNSAKVLPELGRDNLFVTQHYQSNQSVLGIDFT